MPARITHHAWLRRTCVSSGGSVTGSRMRASRASRVEARKRAHARLDRVLRDLLFAQRRGIGSMMQSLRVDHRGFHALVSQRLLHCLNMISRRGREGTGHPLKCPKQQGSLKRAASATSGSSLHQASPIANRIAASTSGLSRKRSPMRAEARSNASRTVRFGLGSRCRLPAPA